MSTNLPLSDRAGKGDLERKAHELSKAMTRTKDEHEFKYLERKLDQVRKDFHTLYNVKEHPTEAPIHPTN
jgi:hypothetical protein